MRTIGRIILRIDGHGGSRIKQVGVRLLSNDKEGNVISVDDK